MNGMRTSFENVRIFASKSSNAPAFGESAIWADTTLGSNERATMPLKYFFIIVNN
jgi:hypothetical protein